jgi:hypothetical protein
MNSEDLQAFIMAFDDFMKHFEVEELYYEHHADAKKIMHDEIEAKAAELEVTCDYYMMEFM